MSADVSPIVRWAAFDAEERLVLERACFHYLSACGDGPYFRTVGDRLLQQVSAANDSIPDEEVSDDCDHAA
jgi:hypothetical protein